MALAALGTSAAASLALVVRIRRMLALRVASLTQIFSVSMSVKAELVKMADVADSPSTLISSVQAASR